MELEMELLSYMVYLHRHLVFINLPRVKQSTIQQRAIVVIAHKVSFHTFATTGFWEILHFNCDLIFWVMKV